MSRPKEIKLTASQQKKVTSLYMGTKKRKAVQDARKISELLSMPRRQVMLTLEQSGCMKFSEGSYA